MAFFLFYCQANRVSAHDSPCANRVIDTSATAAIKCRVSAHDSPCANRVIDTSATAAIKCRVSAHDSPCANRVIDTSPSSSMNHSFNRQKCLKDMS
jgi:hypothetical protein